MSERERPRPRWGAIGVGVALALGTLGISWVLPKMVSAPTHACLVGAIGAVYAGFGLLAPDRRWAIVEVAVAVLFIGLSIAALALGSTAIVIGGLALHGLWDAVHHARAVRTPVPGWYPSFCAAFDWALAALLVATWNHW